jgi:DNA (cytosine-5)-methyltransferase 1
MRFGSVCSGIEAASLAWNPLGWQAAWFSEIEPFPCAVLKHHYPSTPNLGDMTQIPKLIREGKIELPDLLCGGCPCQSFSLAGLRKSLDDNRGNLTLTFCEIADELDAARSVRGLPPIIIFYENVPGILKTHDNAFGCFLGQLAGSEFPLQSGSDRWPNAGFVAGSKRRIAWRVLDAQFFGIPQRRRRLYVVASRNDGRSINPGQILFERRSVRGDSQASGEAGQDFALRAEGGIAGNGAVRDIAGGSVMNFEGGGIRIKAFREGSFGTFVETKIAGTCKAVGGFYGGGDETLLVIWRQ